MKHFKAPKNQHFMMKSMVTALWASLAVFLISSPALAQSKPPGVIWKKQCDDKKKISSCFALQEHFVINTVNGKQQVGGRILRAVISLISDAKKRRVPAIGFQLPLGVDLRAGVAFSLDASKDAKLRFLQCTANGCDVSQRIDSKLLSLLKKGNQMKVAFKAYNDPKTRLIKISLVGLTKIYKQLK